MASLESPRWWTVDEANDALPWVTERVEEARTLIEAARAQTQHAIEVVRSNGHGALPADTAPIREILESLQAEGIILRDLEQGLVDFPARTAAGRPFLLCWLVGEPAVTWWHWPEDGFAGRTPLSQPPDAGP